MLSFDTAIGPCAVQWDAVGLTHVYLPCDRRLSAMRNGDPADVPLTVRHAATAITQLLDGERRDLTEVALSDATVEPFAQRVYAATRTIGPGETATYGEIARALGDPAAARAVGAALASNPFPIVVPCHRVLAADGSLHGFSAPGGLATKRRMLEIERAPGFTQTALFAA